jgi:hypothetical protein
MGEPIEAIENSVRSLNITDDARQDHGQTPPGAIPSYALSIEDIIQKLVQSTNAITLQAQSVRSLAIDTKTHGNLFTMEARTLEGGIEDLTSITSNLQNTINMLNEAKEHSVINYLRSFRSKDEGIVSELLSHFDKQIRDIIKKVLHDNRDREVLWRVAEECFNQITSNSGKLGTCYYFDKMDENTLEWPYDPDFESEQYEEHHNRLEVDKVYAADHQKALDKRFKDREDVSVMERKCWLEFWMRVLNGSPAGPTLFYPPASSDIQDLDLVDVPQYLFRTFDTKSSGINNKSVIASTASQSKSPKFRTDILKLKRHRIAELLSMHLDKPCIGGSNIDNLMSWTSSLLFAMQYAIWRRKSFKFMICTVDSSKFPRGQFVQDICLLKAYHAAAKERGGDVFRMFDLRLRNEDFYNGEYLSQGILNHKHRSCVVSLEQLIRAGLYDLYPEFEDARGNEMWTKRVLELRQNWSAEQTTTDQEIQLALYIAKECFPQFELTDIATVLLSFKNRKHRSREPTSKCPRLYFRLKFILQAVLNTRYNPDLSERLWPEWADKPVEVRRYSIATQAVNAHEASPRALDESLLLHNHKIIREIFD